MNVALAYVFPTINQRLYEPMARRFTQTYQDNPPGSYPHDLYVLVNGLPYPGMKEVFDPLPVSFLRHSNIGRDIGAYQMAAERIDCDLLICLGAPLYFHRAGWLDWLLAAYLSHGPGLYGCWGFHQPKPHIRTTAFWLPRSLLNAYPYMIGDSQRYSFEHGADSLTLWSERKGFHPHQVTWKGVFDKPDWHHAGREESLFLDQHIER